MGYFSTGIYGLTNLEDLIVRPMPIPFLSWLLNQIAIECDVYKPHRCGFNSIPPEIKIIVGTKSHVCSSSTKTFNYLFNFTLSVSSILIPFLPLNVSCLFRLPASMTTDTQSI